MIYDTKRDDELAAENLLPDGEYPFSLISAEEQVSKGGTEMLKLKLGVWNGNSQWHVYDYISPHFMHFKFKHFFQACGQEKVYDAGEIRGDQIGRWEGMCLIGVQQAKDGYPPRNVVSDYKVRQNESSTQETASSDDVPF